MMFIIILLIAITTYLSVRIVMYKNQIKSICTQIEYISNNQTNMRFTTSVANKDFIRLTEDLNEIQYKYKTLLNEYHKQDNNLKSTIVDLSHDIRTPLTSLDGYFQLLAETDDEETRNKYIRIISQRINSLKNILDELFTYAKLENENYALDLEKCCINKVTYDSLFAYYDDFSDVGIEPDIEIIDEPINILAQTRELQRAIENIIKNSLTHSKSFVKVKLIKKNNRVIFSCSNDVDNPESIDISMVFERFYKADKARQNNSTGLGLSIAKKIITKMNGTIDASLIDNIFEITISFDVID